MATKPQKPAMLGTRISPKAQYGLRLLARVQGGTIGDAVEWAINLAMRTTRIGAGDLRLAKVVELVWGKPSEPQQIEVLHRIAPELLDFEQRAAWNLVIRCPDLWRTVYLAVEYDAEESHSFDVEIDSTDPRFNKQYNRNEPKFEVIEEYWEDIRALGVELGRAGEIEEHYSLPEILDGTARKKAGIT